MSDKPPQESSISIHIDPAATDEQMRSTEPLLDICPKCGTPTDGGFGLAGGGYGMYVYCPNAPCDYFAKIQVEE
jgi:hypothetical protein